jgi:hypothetical protein
VRYYTGDEAFEAYVDAAKAQEAAGVPATSVALLLDEVTFWPSENSNAASEVITALTPAMATVPGAMLLCASSPYAKKGVLYDAYREHFGNNGDDVLFWNAATRVMNPSVPESFIAAETAKDPASAAAEYGAEFRDDISSFVSSEIVDAAIIKGRAVLAPSTETYVAFIDVSGGVHDSHTCSVAFKDSNGVAVLACAREINSSDTESVVSEFCSLLRSYGLTRAYADRYGAEWVRAAFDRYAVQLLKSPHDRSEIYLNLLPALNAGQVKLLDLPRLRSQLLALERRTIRGTGRDRIDHPVGGGDDLINSAAGALVLAGGERNHVRWYTGDEAFERYVAAAKDQEAAGVPAPTEDFAAYSRAMEMRAGVRINGRPLEWSEIVAKVKAEKELLR